MRYQLTILAPTMVKDDFGAEVETWTEFTKLKAEKTEISGNYMLDNKEIFHSNHVNWGIYYRPLLKENMRVSIDGKLYRILYIREIPFKRGMILETELINN